MKSSFGMRAALVAIGFTLGGLDFCLAASCDVCVVGGGVAGVAAAHPARVSACPLNQVWAGYQRPVEQTKMASFVTFALSDPGELAVTPGEGENETVMAIYCFYTECGLDINKILW